MVGQKKIQIPTIQAKLPAPCCKERIVWSKVRKEVSNIIAQSNSMNPYMRRILPILDILQQEPPGAQRGQLGLTGRSSRKGKLGMQFAWSKLESRFQLASLMSHELRHAQQILDRNFTTSESTAFLNFNQYLVLCWSSEYEAYSFQAKVLKEIQTSMPIFKPCVNRILSTDDRIKNAIQGNTAKLRSEIVGDYDHRRMKTRYNNEKRNPDNSRKPYVDNYLKLKVFKDNEKIWKPHI